ncbi:MAG: hypothetical protein AAF602_28600, partial [Myxococcota bacterium]
MDWLTRGLWAGVFAMVAQSALAAPPEPDPETPVEAILPVEPDLSALTDEGLGRPPSLRARAAALRDQAVLRRVAEQRAGVEATDAEREAWAAAADAEAAELDGIVTVLANLEERPDLLETAQAPRREAYARARQALLSPALADLVDTDAELAQLEADEAALATQLRELRLRTGPVPPEPVQSALDALSDARTAPGAIERLALLLPS